MIRLILSAAVFTFFFRTISAGPAPYVTYAVPEVRNRIGPVKYVDDSSLNDYEYHVIPSNDYAVTEYDVKKSDLDTITLPTPIMAVARIASCALSFAGWLLRNTSFLLLGASLLVGLCTFTPFCKFNLQPSLLTYIHSYNVPYLDNVQHFFENAYVKYHELQY